MATSILSQDIAAICILFADGKLELSIEEIIEELEEYQDKNQCHFGISKSDFRNLFFNLFYREQDLNFDELDLSNISLKDILGQILEYDYAHFNDEGESWGKLNEDGKWIHNQHAIKYWFGLKRNEYEKKLLLRDEMMKLVPNQNELIPDANIILNFLNSKGIKKIFFKTFTRPGDSS